LLLAALAVAHAHEFGLAPDPKPDVTAHTTAG
jgi:hypothetical protein